MSLTLLNLTAHAKRRTFTLTVATPSAGQLTIQTRTSLMLRWVDWCRIAVPRGLNQVKVRAPDGPGCYVRALLD